MFHRRMSDIQIGMTSKMFSFLGDLSLLKVKQTANIQYNLLIQLLLLVKFVYLTCRITSRVREVMQTSVVTHIIVATLYRRGASAGNIHIFAGAHVC